MDKFQLLSEVTSKIDDVNYLKRMNMRLSKEKQNLADKMSKTTTPKNIPFMNIQARDLERKHNYIKKMLKQRKQLIKSLKKKN